MEMNRGFRLERALSRRLMMMMMMMTMTIVMLCMYISQVKYKAPQHCQCYHWLRLLPLSWISWLAPANSPSQRSCSSSLCRARWSQQLL